MAYGFRDDDYFALKIRSAFPATPDEPFLCERDYRANGFATRECVPHKPKEPHDVY